jgi:Calcineurin-like phosphoesterase
MIRQPRTLAPAVALFATIALLASSAASARTRSARTPSPLAVPATVIGAVGDIACNKAPGNNAHLCRYDDVAASTLHANLDAFLPLGDNQYQNGEYANYNVFYNTYFGALKTVSYPVPGNAEARDPAGRFAGYFQYFGNAAGPPTGYYSYDLGGWHFIALNSELCYEGPPACNSQSAQYQWLQADLAAHPNSATKCTLAYWHRPAFSYLNGGANSDSGTKPLWSLLYAAKADVIMNGHIHNYERWAPMTPNGIANAKRGIREFVVGTGGEEMFSVGDLAGAPATLERAQSKAFGLLQLTLLPKAYKWQWISGVAQPHYRDRGKASCH